MQDYFDRLDLPSAATTADVRSAYWIKRAEFRPENYQADGFDDGVRKKVDEIQDALKEDAPITEVVEPDALTCIALCVGSGH